MASPPGRELKAIALAGPTASGKTDAALAIAQAHGAEIISVDSALVYRGMDVGTAKPSPAERASVPHHLIDIRDPLQAYSAAEFARDAARLVGEVNARGKPALLVGGTMLYFKALFEGLDAMPAADRAVRDTIEAEAAAKGWLCLHAELARVDPATAARVSPNDAQRIQRALEVFRISGQALSSFHAASARRTTAFGAMPLFSLEPGDRAWLHARIAKRFRDMLDAGLVDEVRALRARRDLTAGLPSMRCVGYRQAWEALDGLWPMDQLPDKGIFATRQLAKRQLTWLRGMPGRRTIACDAPNAMEQLLAAVAESL